MAGHWANDVPARAVARPRHMDLDTRMTRFTFAVLIGGLLPVLCQAQNRGVLDGGDADSVRAAMKFFYTVPSGLQDEWEYSVPECRRLPIPVRQGLKNCVPFKEPGVNHQMCESTEYVEMANALTGGKERAVLLYHAFSAKKACVRSRKKALESH